MKKLILDFDGTLVDCSKRDYALYSNSMRDMGEQALPFEVFWDLRRKPENIHALIELTAKTPGASEQFIKLRSERQELPEYTALDQVLPGTHFALWMMAKLYEVHVVSARMDIDNLRHEILKLGLDRHIKSVVAAKTSNKQASIKFLGDDVYAVIGDTEHDVYAAQQLGKTAIAVTTGIRSREFLESLKPNAVVDTLIDALGIIQP